MSDSSSIQMSCYIQPTRVDAAKQLAAQVWIAALWEQGAGTPFRKMRLPSPKARATGEVFASWQPVDTGFSLIERAWHWTDKAQLVYWDALIVAVRRAGWLAILAPLTGSLLLLLLLR